MATKSKHETKRPVSRKNSVACCPCGRQAGSGSWAGIHFFRRSVGKQRATAFQDGDSLWRGYCHAKKVSSQDVGCNSHKQRPIDRDTLNTFSAMLALVTPMARSVLHSYWKVLSTHKSERQCSVGRLVYVILRVYNANPRCFDLPPCRGARFCRSTSSWITCRNRQGST